MSGILDHLRRHGEQVAVLTETHQVTYHHLAESVAVAAQEVGGPRRLVLLETRNDLVTLVRYLAAISGGHVVMPVPAGRDHTAIMQTYEPDVVIDDNGIHHRHRRGRHRLHDGLALLLSTSGSTGSPKLVRLSRTNLVSNAAAIAEYLGIRETDRAATTLPMSYCYGLSVVHSHLLRGAGLVLTEHSVVDDEFWELFRRHRGTALAGVPYTFELLERLGAETLDLPHLRYVTQAGGQMPPERVRRFAGLGLRQGWELFVMYGSTEATARMAYLPPQLASTHPCTIGMPIPGGSITVEPRDGWDDEAVGELVYRGPNVMMGYAHRPDDLALGKTVDALHTGDIARRGSDGLYEVIGRSSRFVKMYGLRIDLQHVEATMRDHGVTAFCTDADDRLAVAAAGHDEGEVQRVAAAAAGLPAGAVRAVAVSELPILPSGKPDYHAVRSLASKDATPNVIGLRELFADVLQIDADGIDPEAGFVDLGGNSLVLRCRCGWNACSGDCLQTGSVCRCRSWRPCPNRSDVGGRGGVRRWKPASRCAQSRSCSSSVHTPGCSSCGAARICCWASPDTTSAGSVSHRCGGPTGCDTYATRSPGSRCRRWRGSWSRLSSPMTTPPRICCWPTSSLAHTTA
jgi:acyl-CoA synthetase (AMP-forming)/AMP-acid ligase II